MTVVLLGLLEITQLAMDPAAEVESQCQLVADLAVPGVGGVRFFEYRNCLVVDDLGLLELAVQSEKVGLALEGLSQAQVIESGGVRGVGQGLLGIECLSVQRLGLALIGAAADQKACQQGAGAGECLFRLSRRSRGDPPAARASQVRCDRPARIPRSRPSLRWMSPICW